MLSTTTTMTDADAAAVAEAVTALGPLDREALVLRLRGRSLEQVAAETRTTTAMVRVRIHRAAATVEQRVGALPNVGGAAAREDDRHIDDVLVDAELGITPVLHARLRAAMTHAHGPERPRFRRTAAVLQVLADRLPGMAALGSVLSLGVVSAVGLASLT